MIKIGIRTNLTRSVERPPLLVLQPDSALLAKFGLLAFRRTKKPVAPVRKSREEHSAKKQKPAGATGQPPAPSTGSSPLYKRPPFTPPAGAARPPASSLPPVVKKPADNPKPVPGSATPVPRPSYNNPPVSPTNQNRETERPEAKTPEPPTTKPTRTEIPEGKLPGSNGNGASTNGNGKTTHTNGNGNGNGVHGPGARSSIFNSSMFTSFPSSRIPPKGNGNLPVQIPMEIPLSPTNGHSGPPANGKNEPPDSHPQPYRRPEPIVQKPDPSAALDQMLKRNLDLPNQAAVLGECEDGLPVLLDLYDPTPGALLITGDEREEQLEILRTALTSLARRNSPRGVQFLIISWEPQSWKDWISKQGYDRYCLAIEGAEDAAVREWVLQLADWTEQRRLGQRSGPPIVLIMDTLSFMPRLDYDVRLNFDWMAKEGPDAQIWPVAAISFELAKSLSGRRLLRAFRTRVYGCASEPKDYIQLAGLDEQEAGQFGKPGAFSVRVGESWLRFRLPGRWNSGKR